LYDLETKEFFVSRDVEFLKTTFPFDQEVSEQREKCYVKYYWC